MVKTDVVGEHEKIIYKFWIQNLSNEIYDKIIDGIFFFIIHLRELF